MQCLLIKAQVPVRQLRFVTVHISNNYFLIINQQDAYILARLLVHSKFTNDLVPKVAEIYNTVRCPEGNRVLSLSNETGRMYGLLTPELEDYNEGDSIPLTILEHTVMEIEKKFEWTWKGTAENDVKKAFELLDSLV